MNLPTPASRNLFFGAILSAILLLAAWAYMPGLAGAFLFDDYANLPALGETGSIHNAAAFWRYITSGQADPTGRPLALLSFLVDARDWPADPWPFKRTNLLIHLLNTALLAVLLRRLGRLVLRDDGTSCIESRIKRWPTQLRIDLAALSAALVWAVHPLFVSTTLYVVQRQAMLPATFGLLGLIGWLKGREWIAAGMARGYVLTLVSIGLATLAGLGSKANGVLLPLYALIIEWVLLQQRSPLPFPMQSRYRRLVLLVFLLPSIMVALYLLQIGLATFGRDLSPIRDWTLGQRLLTEPRILFTYLELLWVPRPYTTGLFNDQIEASVSLTQPLSTALSLAGLGLLLTATLLLRKRFSLAATALLFFFGGHILESSTVPLELYFEHRNYVPALLMFWPMSVWLMGLTTSTPKATGTTTSPKPRVLVEKTFLGSLIIITCAGLLLTMTRGSATLWGSPPEQALVWGALNPKSSRAQAYAAQAEISSGLPARAETRLRQALLRAPDDLQLTLNLLSAQCAQGAITLDTMTAAQQALSVTDRSGMLFMGWFERILAIAKSGQCKGLTVDALEQLLQIALRNTRLTSSPGEAQDLLHLQGVIWLERGNANQALLSFQQAAQRLYKPELILQQAALLGSYGFPHQALAQLQYANTITFPSTPRNGMARLHDWVLKRQGYWAAEREHLRRVLEDDIRHSPPGSNDNSQ